MLTGLVNLDNDKATTLTVSYWCTTLSMKNVLCNVLYDDPDENHKPNHVLNYLDLSLPHAP